jgi:hypothetical protein
MIDTVLELPQEMTPLADKTPDLTQAPVWLPYLALAVTVAAFAMNAPARLAALQRSSREELSPITEDYPARSFTAPRAGWIGKPVPPWARFTPR